MIDAQSIVVAGVATGQQSSEGEILRYGFWHAVALALPDGRLGVPAVQPAFLDDPRIADPDRPTWTDMWNTRDPELLALDVGSRPGRLATTAAEQDRLSIKIHYEALGSGAPTAATGPALVRHSSLQWVVSRLGGDDVEQ